MAGTNERASRVQVLKPGRFPGAALLAWLQIVRSHGGISASKLHHSLPWLFRYIVLEPSRIYESLKYDHRIETHRLSEDPVFVLGHWRSGTSFLQELLSLDDRHATCSLFQCMFSECALSTQRWLPVLIDRVATTFGIRYAIQDRPLRSALPAEEEIAMLCMTDRASSNWGQIFPTRMRQYINDTFADKYDDDAWLEGYRFVVKKLSIAHGGERLVLKSPMNTARLPLLKAAYPGAAFIHIHRHPMDVFASSRRLWNMILRQSALQRVTAEDIDQLVLDVYEAVMRRYLEDRETVSQAHLIEVRYENLKADPVAVLGEVYSAVDLGQPPTDAIRNFMRSTPTPSVKSRSIDPALERRIRAQWNFAFDAWGYE